MKQLYWAFAAVFMAWTWTAGLAQPVDEQGGPSQTSPIREEGDRPKDSRFLESLSPEMRKRFRAAREKALQDPRLQELRKKAKRAKREFFQAVRAKMLEVDPGLANIVKKHAFERRAWRTWRNEDGESRFGSLTDAEQEKLISSFEKASDDPAVQAARTREDEANTVQEQRAAQGEYLKVLHDAMIKVDPSVAPILQKLGPAGPQSSSASGAEE
jgi:hypothetical protein